jgi:hypothetical protein
MAGYIPPRQTLGRRPPVAAATQIWKPNTGQDPARYVVTMSELYHKRPALIVGDQVFVWPIGTEGFRRTGNATLGIHHYLGDNRVDVHVIHRDEARIEMSGTFPGFTAQDNMVALIQVLTGTTPKKGKILYLPGIFENVQYVTVENYDFSHQEDDRTHSIAYSISFIRTDIGRRALDPHGQPPVPNPWIRKIGKGESARTVIVRSGVRTLKAVAHRAYGTPNLWHRVVLLNRNTILKYQKKRKIKIPSHKMPTYRWPIGTKFRV